MRLKRTGSAEKEDRSLRAWRCLACGIELNYLTGRPNASRWTGMATECRKCGREATAVARAANPERAREQGRNAYAANARHYRKKKRAWIIANPAKRRAIQRRFARSPGGKLKFQRRRARLAGVESTLTSAEWAEILEVFGHRCAYCLKHESECGKLEQEHVIAVSRGGGHTSENVVPACKRCNSKKKDRPVFAMVAA